MSIVCIGPIGPCLTESYVVQFRWDACIYDIFRLEPGSWLVVGMIPMLKGRTVKRAGRLGRTKTHRYLRIHDNTHDSRIRIYLCRYMPVLRFECLIWIRLYLHVANYMCMCMNRILQGYVVVFIPQPHWASSITLIH